MRLLMELIAFVCFTAVIGFAMDALVFLLTLMVRLACEIFFWLTKWNRRVID